MSRYPGQWAFRSASATVAQSFAVDNATTNAVTDVLTLAHTTSGTAAAGLAAGVLFTGEDAAGNAENLARVAGVLITATNASEASGVDVSTRTAGAALSVKYRFGGDGGFLVGTTTALANAGIGLANTVALYGSNAAGSVYLNLAQITAANRAALGATTSILQLQGTEQYHLSGASTFYGYTTPDTYVWSTGALDETTGGGGTSTWRVGDVASATDKAGKALVIRAGRGRGAGAGSTVALQASTAVASGTGAHTDTTVLTLSSARAACGVALQVKSYDTTARDALTAAAGDIIYNTSTSKFQGYNGAWVDFH